MRVFRVTAIWFFGLLAASIIGGIVGGRLGPYSDGGFFGVIAGICVFVCLRLWITTARQ